jgi:type I restriction enzyme S subunit
MPENAKTPAIRYAKFAGAWEQRKLGDMMEITSVKRIHQSDWTDSGVRFLRARDIVSASKGEEPADYLYISKEKYDEYSRLSGKVKIGDLLVTGVGSIGIPMLVNTDEPLYFKDGNVIWFRNESIDGDFFYYSFTAKNIQKFIRDVAGIGTVGTYTIDSGKKTPIYIPSMGEQVKVGQFFTAVSNLITLHQREYDKTVNIKKAMLEKMFPKDGEDKPEIRFAGFTDAWEQRKVIDIAPLQRGFDLPVSEMQEGNYPVVMSNGIGAFHSKYKAKAPGVVTGRSGTIGNLTFVETDYWPHNTALWVTDFKGNDEKFIFYLYQKLGLKRFGTGSGVPTLNRNDVHDTKASIPSITEQKQIAQLFDSISNLITLHQRELVKLQNIKKALLEKMFV